jgi:hypothetical protein
MNHPRLAVRDPLKGTDLVARQSRFHGASEPNTSLKGFFS